MPLQTRAGSELTGGPELRLPPPYTLVRLRELGDAFGHAIKAAAEQGAGTLVHVGRFDLAEFALVLEPEEPLRQARLSFYAGMTALIDALSAVAQPNTSVTIDWPDSIRVNMGLVGGGRLAWPQDAREDEVPPWLVFGAMVRMSSMSGTEPGTSPNVTTLAEEGFGDILSSQVVESFARHFMVAADLWQERGFGAVAGSYLERLSREQGLRRDIDDNGDLLVHKMTSDKVERRALLPRLAAPGWLDAAAGEPQS